jgi:hypothetical protein
MKGLKNLKNIIKSQQQQLQHQQHQTQSASSSSEPKISNERISLISDQDFLAYLKPFLNIVRSNETSGPIIGVALLSINKFIQYFVKGNDKSKRQTKRKKK